MAPKTPSQNSLVAKLKELAAKTREHQEEHDKEERARADGLPSGVRPTFDQVLHGDALASQAKGHNKP